MYKRLCRRNMLWTIKCNYLHLHLYGIILSNILRNNCLLTINTILILLYDTDMQLRVSTSCMVFFRPFVYRGSEKSLARPTSRCILFDGENNSFDAGLVMYINSTNIPPIMIINRNCEIQNLLLLQLVSFLVGLRTYQHPCT